MSRERWATTDDWDLAHATASHRAETFLRTIGKWKDENKPQLIESDSTVQGTVSAAKILIDHFTHDPLDPLHPPTHQTAE